MREIGKYIVLEGGEHVGKSTQAWELATAIGALNVREPGGTPAGEKIRSILLDPLVHKDPKTEVLLHAAQRAELFETLTRRSLKHGRPVVSDRSWISSAAYQGAQGVPFEDIRRVNEYALGEYIKPDLLIVLDAAPEAVAGRSTEPADYYEQQNNEFHAAVRQNFLTLAKDLGGIVIDATGDIAEVGSQIRESVRDNLGV